jgi:anti-anti-sigma factor
VLSDVDLAALAEAWSGGDESAVVVDLADVRSLSSAGLAKLLLFRRSAVGTSRRLKVENIHPDIREVFRIARLDQVFDLG